MSKSYVWFACCKGVMQWTGWGGCGAGVLGLRSQEEALMEVRCLQSLAPHFNVVPYLGAWWAPSSLAGAASIYTVFEMSRTTLCGLCDRLI